MALCSEGNVPSDPSSAQPPPECLTDRHDFIPTIQSPVADLVLGQAGVAHPSVTVDILQTDHTHI